MAPSTASTSAETYGIPSVVQSLWELPVGGLPLIVVMNKDVWDSISKKDQEAILNVAKGHPKRFHEIYEIGGDKKALEEFKAASVKIIEPDAESLKQLRVAAEKIWDEVGQGAGRCRADPAASAQTTLSNSRKSMPRKVRPLKK